MLDTKMGTTQQGGAKKTNPTANGSANQVETAHKTTTTTQKKVNVVGPKISIKAKVHDKSQDDYIISQVEKPHDSFDKEKLIQIIEGYASEQEKLNRKSWAFTIKAGEPAIKQEDIIIFTLFNKTQEVEFNKNREEFTHYLRDKLNNQFVMIQTELKEKDDTVVKTIDPVQKFDNMVKENPLLIDLRNKFKLDL